MLKALPTSQTILPDIINEDYVFIDKTQFIEKYEESKKKVSLFLRPRRFGKTMFTEILKYYYDAALEKESSGIFSSTYIATHPTPLKSAFHVVKFDFSGIDTSGGTRTVLDSFKYKIIQGIDDFFCRYPDTIPGDIRKLALSGEKGELSKAVFKYYGDTSLFPTAGRVTDDFITYLKAFPRKVMVIIDEYDNFTNDILSRDVGAFTEIARKEGDVSKFYQVLRSRQQANIIDRIFITGVLPITLDTSLSGFVSDKIYLDAEFNEMAGFSDTEVAELLEETVDFDKCGFSPDDLRKEMKERYDGYRFSEVADTSVYNPALCLKFISDLISGRYKKLPPLQTVSGNDMDFEKFSGYLGLIDETALNTLIDILDADTDMGANPEPGTERKGYLGVPGLSESLKITSDGSRLDDAAGVTLLYHLGFLTMMTNEEARKTVYGYQEGMTYLKIPNCYYRKLFTQYRLSSSYPEIFSKVRSEKWGIGELSRTNDVRCLSDMLKSIAGAFVKTSCSREGEDRIVLTVYVALSMLAGSSFDLTREYSIRHNHQYVFSDGLDDDEYGDPDTESNESSEGGDTAESEESFEMALARIGLETVESRDRAANIKKGRADLVALNTGTGPSYIFEFKYQRDTKSSQDTKVKTIKTLYDRAVKQLNFYVTDDKLKEIPDLHKYVIIFAYGKFILKEV